MVIAAFPAESQAGNRTQAGPMASNRSTSSDGWSACSTASGGGPTAGTALTPYFAPFVEMKNVALARSPSLYVPTQTL